MLAMVERVKAAMIGQAAQQQAELAALTSSSVQSAEAAASGSLQAAATAPVVTPAAASAPQPAAAAPVNRYYLGEEEGDASMGETQGPASPTSFSSTASAVESYRPDAVALARWYDGLASFSQGKASSIPTHPSGSGVASAAASYAVVLQLAESLIHCPPMLPASSSNSAPATSSSASSATSSADGAAVSPAEDAVTVGSIALPPLARHPRLLPPAPSSLSSSASAPQAAPGSLPSPPPPPPSSGPVFDSYRCTLLAGLLSGTPWLHAPLAVVELEKKDASTLLGTKRRDTQAGNAGSSIDANLQRQLAGMSAIVNVGRKWLIDSLRVLLSTGPAGSVDASCLWPMLLALQRADSSTRAGFGATTTGGGKDAVVAHALSDAVAKLSGSASPDAAASAATAAAGNGSNKRARLLALINNVSGGSRNSIGATIDPRERTMALLVILRKGYATWCLRSRSSGVLPSLALKTTSSNASHLAPWQLPTLSLDLPQSHAEALKSALLLLQPPSSSAASRDFSLSSAFSSTSLLTKLSLLRSLTSLGLPPEPLAHAAMACMQNALKHASFDHSSSCVGKSAGDASKQKLQLLTSQAGWAVLHTAVILLRLLVDYGRLPLALQLLRSWCGDDHSSSLVGSATAFSPSASSSASSDAPLSLLGRLPLPCAAWLRGLQMYVITTGAMPREDGYRMPATLTLRPLAAAPALSAILSTAVASATATPSAGPKTPLLASPSQHAAGSSSDISSLRSAVQAAAQSEVEWVTAQLSASSTSERVFALSAVSPLLSDALRLQMQLASQHQQLPAKAAIGVEKSDVSVHALLPVSQQLLRVVFLCTPSAVPAGQSGDDNDESAARASLLRLASSCTLPPSLMPVAMEMLLALHAPATSSASVSSFGASGASSASAATAAAYQLARETLLGACTAVTQACARVRAESASITSSLSSDAPVSLPELTSGIVTATPAYLTSLAAVAASLTSACANVSTALALLLQHNANGSTSSASGTYDARRLVRKLLGGFSIHLHRQLLLGGEEGAGASSASGGGKDAIFDLDGDDFDADEGDEDKEDDGVGPRAPSAGGSSLTQSSSTSSAPLGSPAWFAQLFSEVTISGTVAALPPPPAYRVAHCVSQLGKVWCASLLPAAMLSGSASTTAAGVASGASVLLQVPQLLALTSVAYTSSNSSTTIGAEAAWDPANTAICRPLATALRNALALCSLNELISGCYPSGGGASSESNAEVLVPHVVGSLQQNQAALEAPEVTFRPVPVSQLAQRAWPLPPAWSVAQACAQWATACLQMRLALQARSSSLALPAEPPRSFASSAFGCLSWAICAASAASTAASILADSSSSSAHTLTDDVIERLLASAVSDVTVLAARVRSYGVPMEAAASVESSAANPAKDETSDAVPVFKPSLTLWSDAAFSHRVTAWLLSAPKAPAATVDYAALPPLTSAASGKGKKKQQQQAASSAGSAEAAAVCDKALTAAAALVAAGRPATLSASPRPAGAAVSATAAPAAADTTATTTSSVDTLLPPPVTGVTALIEPGWWGPDPAVTEHLTSLVADVLALGDSAQQQQQQSAPATARAVALVLKAIDRSSAGNVIHQPLVLQHAEWGLKGLPYHLRNDQHGRVVAGVIAAEKQRKALKLSASTAQDGINASSSNNNSNSNMTSRGTDNTSSSVAAGETEAVKPAALRTAAASSNGDGSYSAHKVTDALLSAPGLFHPELPLLCQPALPAGVLLPLTEAGGTSAGAGGSGGHIPSSSSSSSAFALRYALARACNGAPVTRLALLRRAVAVDVAASAGAATPTASLAAAVRLASEFPCVSSAWAPLQAIAGVHCAVLQQALAPPPRSADKPQ